MKQEPLYILIDTKDKYELPLFVGTIEELATRQGVTQNAIASAISHAKHRGQNCKYIRVDFDS